MQVVDSYSFITKFINDRRGIIRKQAEVATVSLKPEGISYFLDTTNFTISEWQQLKLMEVLRGMEHFRPPTFKTWLVSGNRDVVLFALRLIRHYNQNESAASIIELVKHKNERIKMEAIQCIKEFCIINALDTLKAVFGKTGEAVKIEILDTLATLGNEEDLEFLKKVEQSTSSFLVRNKAQMAINEIMPETFIPSKDILTQKELDASELVEDQFNHEYLTEQINKIATEGELENDEFIEEHEPNADESESEQEVQNELEVESSQVIEVFEVDTETIPELDVIENTVNGEKSDEEAAPNFEIDVIDDELDSSINNQIGLLGNSEDELEPASQQEIPEAEHYFKMCHEDKINFIELLEDSATDKETVLLEELMQKEEDSEIRYRLFKILKAIKGGEKDIASTENKNEKVVESIFHSLFEYASDLDSKFILLKEIVEVGDEKEIPLLDLLSNDKNPSVKIEAEKTKKALLDRLCDNQTEPPIFNAFSDDSTKSIDKPISKSITSSDHERLPLELCFLKEYGIQNSTEKEPEISFELTEEFYQDQERRIAIDK